MFHLQYIMPVTVFQLDQLLIHCLMVGNSWYARGLLTWMNGCGLTMMVWLFSPSYISVVNNLYFDHLYGCTHLQLYNCPLPGKSVVLYLSVQPLHFLEVTLSRTNVAPCPSSLLRKGRGEKHKKQCFWWQIDWAGQISVTQHICKRVILYTSPSPCREVFQQKYNPKKVCLNFARFPQPKTVVDQWIHFFNLTS